MIVNHDKALAGRRSKNPRRSVGAIGMHEHKQDPDRRNNTGMRAKCFHLTRKVVKEGIQRTIVRCNCTGKGRPIERPLPFDLLNRESVALSPGAV